MSYQDAFHARTTIENALSWLKEEDGWAREDLEDLAVDSVASLYDEDE